MLSVKAAEMLGFQVPHPPGVDMLLLLRGVPSILSEEQRVEMVTGKYRRKTRDGCRDGSERGLLVMRKGPFLYPPAGELRNELVRQLISEGLLIPSPIVHVVADQ